MGELRFSTDPTEMDAVAIHAVLTEMYWSRGIPLETYRGRGLATRMMKAMTTHPNLQGLRRWLLSTRDAHGLYLKFGFAPVSAPDRLMERRDPDVYARTSPTE